MLLYFAYGSNLDLPQMRMRCPQSSVVCPGWLQGYRLDFTRYSSVWKCGVADIIASKGDEVWGLVYNIADKDLENLDHYEGYPSAYTRFQASVHTEDDVLDDVWTYTVREKCAFKPPSRAYLDIIKRAAKEYRFPTFYRDYLEGISPEDPQ